METVLIIDDYLPLLQLYAKEFKREGYRVVAAQDLAEATRCIQAHSLAAVIVEIGALGKEEFEALVQTLNQRPKTPIIVNTGELGRCAVANWNPWIDVWVTKSSDLAPLKTVLKALKNKQSLTGFLCVACQFYEPVNEDLGKCLLMGQTAWPKWVACRNFIPPASSKTTGLSRSL